MKNAITAREAEVHFQFDIFVPSIADEPFHQFQSIAGWINVNSKAQSKTTGTVHVSTDAYLLSLPSLLGQTLDASEYRGKTVLLELEMQCNEDDALGEAGAFVWASRQEQPNANPFPGRSTRQHGSPYVGHRVLVAKTKAANGSSSWSDSLKTERRVQRNALSADAPSRIVTVPFAVPIDADHVSFGSYSKNSEIRVSKVRFQMTDSTASPTSLQGVNDATEDMPYNVLVVPGYTIRKSPTELNFEQSVPKPAEFAARPSGSESR